MAIIQHNSEPIVRGEFTGCKIKTKIVTANKSKIIWSYSIWTSDEEETDWDLAIKDIDDLITMLQELREVSDSDVS